MEDRINNGDHLIDRINHLERERDELRKDIEQLCLQQSGPSYLAVATRMHFQRTAGLEQEIENLKKKLAVCTRNNTNLQEELSEVYNIKSQLADLHSVEVSKNMESEKQLKFFQGCVATAFAERDNALMEAEKAKEREDFMSQEVNTLHERVEEMTSNFLEEKKLHASLQIDLMKLKEQNENFLKVISKFYDIRQSFSGVIDEMCLDDKCDCLLQDAPEIWSFNSNMENPSSEYIIALEKELETLRSSADRYQNKMRLGLEIEDHLKKRVRELEKKKILFDDIVKNKIPELYHSHTHHRCEVMNLLEHEKTQFKRMLDVLHERIKELIENQTRDFGPPQGDTVIVNIECRDVHTTTDVDADLVHEKKDPALPIIIPEGTASEALAEALQEKNKTPASSIIVPVETSDTSDALAQALHGKVAALLLLSQQDERYLLERNVSAVLQKKMEELQRNLLQVTNEKVKALMELAQLRQNIQLLHENVGQGFNGGALWAEIGDKSIVDHEKDGKLRSMLKKTYLRRWINRPDFDGDAHIHNYEGNPNNKKFNYSGDFASLKIENATLKESIESMEHLTSSVHRLRRSLLKAKDSSTSLSSVTSTVAVLDGIITEAKLVKTALGSSLPVSRSAEVDTASFGEVLVFEPTDGCGDLSRVKMDNVSAAGFEMAELLILAAQILKEGMHEKVFM